MCCNCKSCSYLFTCCSDSVVMCEDNPRCEGEVDYFCLTCLANGAGDKEEED